MKKFWNWIVAHKLVSIIVSVVLVAGIACAIVLPIALKDDKPKHTHKYATTLSYDGTNHWYECACGAKSEEAAHNYATEYSHNATKHWHECECGAKNGEAEHGFGTWTVKTPAGCGLDMVKERACSCGEKDTTTVADTKLESHNTLVMIANDFINIAAGQQYSGQLVADVKILNGILAVGDKLTVDGYDGEITVEAIEAKREGVYELLNQVDYTCTDPVQVLFEEIVSKTEFTEGNYITKSEVPVQRYTKFTLQITMNTERKSPIFGNYQSNLELPGGVKFTVVTSDVVGGASGEDEFIAPDESGTMTVTIVTEGVSVIVWEGMTVVGKENTKTIFNGTVTGVLPA